MDHSILDPKTLDTFQTLYYVIRTQHTYDWVARKGRSELLARKHALHYIQGIATRRSMRWHCRNKIETTSIG
jgi:hypothetical protein